MFGVCRSFSEKTVCSALWTSWKKMKLKFFVFICFWWGIIWHVHISVKTFIQYISKSIIPTFTHYHQGKISSPRDNICWYTPWYRRIELAECISWYTLSINLVYRDKKENWKIISQSWTRTNFFLKVEPEKIWNIPKRIFENGNSCWALIHRMSYLKSTNSLSDQN